MARRQTRTAFGAAALYNQSARFSAHANAEAVCLRTAAVIRLKCTFHAYLLKVLILKAVRLTTRYSDVKECEFRCFGSV